MQSSQDRLVLPRLSKRGILLFQFKSQEAQYALCPKVNCMTKKIFKHVFQTTCTLTLCICVTVLESCHIDVSSLCASQRVLDIVKMLINQKENVSGKDI